ncbi:MAG TPA: hypothetical protein VK447_14785, partial [Myxococcaceae bacterium]|nr:hypothetical protein [Myxococcaceae bacterium]
DEAASAVLAFETWAHGVHTHARAPGPGQVGLAQDVAAAAFPFDLSELLFAVKAIRRHLLGRAWVGGPFELSGLDTLRQVALRPGRGPWRVAVRRAAGRLEVSPISPTVAEALRVAERLPSKEDFISGRAGAPEEGVREALAAGLVRIG